MKYLIFLDIDGTLLARGGVPSRTLTAIQKAVDEGHFVFINTGRSKGNVPFSHLKDVPLTGIVAGLGAYIEMEGEVLFSHAMPKDEIAFAMQVADDIGTGLVLEGEDMLLDYLPEQLDPHWVSNRPAVESVEDMERRFPDLRVSKISFTKPLSPEAAERLSARLGVISHPTYAEIFSKGFSKATAMDFLKARLNIADDHVIAMGDSLNDVSMLEAAGTGIAMGNAREDVKAMGFPLCGCNDEDGVARYIDEHILR